MPRVHRQLVVPRNVKPLHHDAGGKVSDLHVEAMAVVFGAQFLSPADPSMILLLLFLQKMMMMLFIGT
jgi:hypothetical protein